MVGGGVQGAMSGRKYYITPYTSAGPWQQSNTLDLRSSLSRFFQLVKTEAGGLLEKETCRDCLHVGFVCSTLTQRVSVWICRSLKPSFRPSLSSPLELCFLC